MKSNIDLTENRMFRDSRERIDNWRSEIDILLFGKPKVPWFHTLNGFREIHSDEEMRESSKEDSIIITGNKKRRKEFIEFRSYGFTCCDRCGARLHKTPWDMNFYPLCTVCKDDLDKEFHDKCLWRQSLTIHEPESAPQILNF